MNGWTSEQEEYRQAVRRFVDAEVAPQRHAMEHEGMLPYGPIRRYYEAFGVGEAALERFHRSLSSEGSVRRATESAAETLIPMVELSRQSPGMVTAMGVSSSLAAGAILRAGSREQKLRWAPQLLTFETIGAWAITEPDSGSDAFGGMGTTARPEEGGWILNGSKTFITNGPYANTIILICKLDDGLATGRRQIMTFVLDRGMPGLIQGPPLRKLGLHSSPTGELFLDDVRVGPDRLLDTSARSAGSSSRVGARQAFAKERASVTAMALGIIDRCLQLSLEYARSRIQFGKPIGEFQQIQLKLAHMEIARLNVENLLLRYSAGVDSGSPPSLAEASAMKLYAAGATVQVALEAVQIFGGNGYMAENQVEQLLRDSKALQIYGGTDEIQVMHIGRELLHHRT